MLLADGQSTEVRKARATAIVGSLSWIGVREGNVLDPAVSLHHSKARAEVRTQIHVIDYVLDVLYTGHGLDAFSFCSREVEV
jgi:hypothetical protein